MATTRDRATSRTRRAALQAAMLGFFVVALDSQVVNVALPTIRTDLDGTLPALQWVVTGYTLSLSALLLCGGTLSERVGAKRAYVAGMVVFVVASAACGLAPSLPVLVAARVAQGVGAALVTPTSLALIRQEYVDRAARTRAIAYWAMGGAVAAAAGPVLGGALAELDWRWVFYLNLPVGVLAVLVLQRLGRSPRRVAPFDATGQVSAIVALAGLTFAIIHGPELGYTSRWVLVGYALAVVGGATFLVSQARGRHPMVPLHLFRSRPVVVTLVAAFVGLAAFYGMVFLQSLYLQQERALSPLATGLLFIPMTGLVAVLNPLAARTAVRWGPVVPIVGGQVAVAAGLVALALAPPGTAPWVVAALMVPVGVGGSFTVPPLTTMLLDAVPGERAGTASGVLNTARQVGASLGVAAVGAIVASGPDFLSGHRSALLGLAVLVVLTTAASTTLRRSHTNLPVAPPLQRDPEAEATSAPSRS